MEATSQIEHRHAMHMKVVSTARASGNGRSQTGNQEQYYPDSDRGEHGLVGWRYAVDKPNCRNVNQNDSEKISSPAPYQFQSRPIFRHIFIGISHKVQAFPKKMSANKQRV